MPLLQLSKASTIGLDKKCNMGVGWEKLFVCTYRWRLWSRCFSWLCLPWLWSCLLLNLYM